MSTIRIRLTAYLVLILSLIISVRLIKDIIKINQADERITQADQELLTAKQEQLELKRELNDIGSDFWQEAQFRNTLNMARPNEVVVVVPDEISQTKLIEESLSEEGKELTNWQKWWLVFTD